MKKLRVLILTHESLVPPDALDGHSQQEIDEWQTEYDVMSCLRQAGHEVQVLGLYDNLGDLRARITDWQPGEEKTITGPSCDMHGVRAGYMPPPW